MFADQRPKVQAKSTETLFAILNKHGNSFNEEFWELIFKGVLQSLFDEIHFSFQLKGHKKELLSVKSSSQFAFTNIADLFSNFFDKLEGFLPTIMNILINSIQNTHEVIFYSN